MPVMISLPLRGGFVLALASLVACSSPSSGTDEGPNDASVATLHDASAPDIADASGDAPSFSLSDADLDEDGGAEVVGTCDASQEGLLLEQGTDFNSTCDEVDVCQKGSLLRVHAASSDGGASEAVCPTPSCVGDEDAGPPSGSCTVNAVCTFPHSYCFCSDDGDGGATYKCTKEDPACPAGRPRFGASCAGVTEATQCIYETCESMNVLHDVATCTSGVWTSGQVEDICGP